MDSRDARAPPRSASDRFPFARRARPGPWSPVALPWAARGRVAFTISGRHDFQRRKTGSEPAGVPCQQGPAFHRRMRADEEVRRHLPPAAAASSALGKGLRRQEQGRPRNLTQCQPQRGHGAIQSFERRERRRDLGVDDRVDRQRMNAGLRAVDRSTSLPTAVRPAGRPPGHSCRPATSVIRAQQLHEFIRSPAHIGTAPHGVESVSRRPRCALGRARPVQDDLPCGIHRELHGRSGQQPQFIADPLGDGDLALAGQGRRHGGHQHHCQAENGNTTHRRMLTWTCDLGVPSRSAGVRAERPLAHAIVETTVPGQEPSSGGRAQRREQNLHQQQKAARQRGQGGRGPGLPSRPS